MDSYHYHLHFVDGLYKNNMGHGSLTDKGEALVKQGIHTTWRNNENIPKRNYAFYFKTKKQAKKQLSFLPKEIRKHYKVEELLALSCFNI